eukprot:jgi/Tetstr1/436755/TSEL_025535.t1
MECVCCASFTSSTSGLPPLKEHSADGSFHTRLALSCPACDAALVPCDNCGALAAADETVAATPYARAGCRRCGAAVLLGGAARARVGLPPNATLRVEDAVRVQLQVCGAARYREAVVQQLEALRRQLRQQAPDGGSGERKRSAGEASSAQRAAKRARLAVEATPEAAGALDGRDPGSPASAGAGAGEAERQATLARMARCRWQLVNIEEQAGQAQGRSGAAPGGGPPRFQRIHVALLRAAHDAPAFRAALESALGDAGGGGGDGGGNGAATAAAREAAAVAAGAESFLDARPRLEGCRRGAASAASVLRYAQADARPLLASALPEQSCAGRLLLGMLGQQHGQQAAAAGRAAAELASSMRAIRRQQHMLCLLLGLPAAGPPPGSGALVAVRLAEQDRGAQATAEGEAEGVLLALLDLWRRLYHDVSHAALRLRGACADPRAPGPHIEALAAGRPGV